MAATPYPRSSNVAQDDGDDDVYEAAARRMVPSWQGAASPAPANAPAEPRRTTAMYVQATPRSVPSQPPQQSYASPVASIPPPRSRAPGPSAMATTPQFAPAEPMGLARVQHSAPSQLPSLLTPQPYGGYGADDDDTSAPKSNRLLQVGVALAVLLVAGAGVVALRQEPAPVGRVAEVAAPARPALLAPAEPLAPVRAAALEPALAEAPVAAAAQAPASTQLPPVVDEPAAPTPARSRAQPAARAGAKVPVATRAAPPRAVERRAPRVSEPVRRAAPVYAPPAQPKPAKRAGSGSGGASFGSRAISDNPY